MVLCGEAVVPIYINHWVSSVGNFSYGIKDNVFNICAQKITVVLKYILK